MPESKFTVYELPLCCDLGFEVLSRGLDDEDFYFIHNSTYKVKAKYCPFCGMELRLARLESHVRGPISYANRGNANGDLFTEKALRRVVASDYRDTLVFSDYTSSSLHFVVGTLNKLWYGYQDELQADIILLNITRVSVITELVKSGLCIPAPLWNEVEYKDDGTGCRVVSSCKLERVGFLPIAESVWHERI